MAATEASTAPTRTFGANPLYGMALGILTALGVLGSTYVSVHERHAGVLMWALTGMYLLALATVVSLRVGVNDEGLTQRWLFSRLQVNWRDVARMEKTARAYSLRDIKGTNLVLLFLLPPSAQQTIADEAMTRARLRPAREAPKSPVLEQWERKPK